jgi:hypothetical protein
METMMNNLANSLSELLVKKEPLCAELEPYLHYRKVGGWMLHHPLLIHMFVDLERCAWLNESYRQKSKGIEEALKEKKWSRYIFYHERPYRLAALLRCHEAGLHDEAYWNFVGDVWVDSDNIWQNIKTWRKIWSQPDPNRAACMDAEEREHYFGLPDSLTVYRGVKLRKAVNGLSWTFDLERAKWFARRWATKEQQSMVAIGTVHKKNILAVFLGRNEKEIVSNKVNVQRIAALEELNEHGTKGPTRKIKH